MDACSEMKIEDIDKTKLSKAPDKELYVLRLRFIQLWEKNFKGNQKQTVGELERSDFLEKYRLLINEMGKRNLTHSIADIDHAAFKKAIMGIDVPSLGDVVVTPDYVTIGGSFVKSPKDSNDIDVIIRENEDNRDEGFELKLSRLIQGQVKKNCHFIYAPAGPHSSFMPLFDKVLRAKEETRIVKVKEDYQKSAQDYYENLDKWNDAFEADYGELVKHLVGETVLSLGCGTGRVEKRLVKKDYEVEGVDNNDTALKMCENANLKTKKIDLEKEELPYEDGSFDTVIGLHILEHLEKPEKTIAEAERVAKKRVIFIVPLGARADITHKQEYKKLEDFKKLFDKADVHLVENGDNAATAAYKPPSIATGAKKTEKAMKLRPFGEFTPPKPTMANLTEAFKFEDIENWIKDRWPVAVEEKLNGFRVVAEKSGDKVKIWTEGRKDRTKQFSSLIGVLSKVPDDFILDMSIGIDRNGEPLPRIKLMTLMADEPELEEGDVIKATCFDLPYWKEDLHEKPLSERRKLLEMFYKKYLKDKNFALTNFVVVKNQKELETQFNKLSKLPQSEGVLIKALDSIWDTDGSIEGWAKIKIEAEIKVIVLARNTTKIAGTYNYKCGVLPGDSKFENLIEFKGKKYIDLGNTFNIKLKAEPGDVLTIGVEEIIPQDNVLDWLGPRVLDIDEDRKEPYFANQVIDIAAKANILQKAEEGNIDYKIDETGKAILQLHIMGIEEEKIDALKKVSAESVRSRSNPTKLRMLLKGAIGEQGCHIDLRMVRKGDDYFEGGEIMVGNLTGLTKLKKLDEGGKLRFGWKVPRKEEPTAETIRGPVSWMRAGKNKIEIIPPGEAGATTNKYGAMLILDDFLWTMTQADRHAKKLDIKGSTLFGDCTFLMAYVPVAEGRVWMISKLKIEEEKKFEKFVPIFDISKKEDEHIVCGIVYEPDVEDSQGDMASEEEIRKAAYQFMEEVQKFKVNHAGKGVRVKVLESYVAPQNLTIAGQFIKKGSWLLTTRVLDDKIWQKVKNGEITGYSMAGQARTA